MSLIGIARRHQRHGFFRKINHNAGQAGNGIAVFLIFSARLADGGKMIARRISKLRQKFDGYQFFGRETFKNLIEHFFIDHGKSVDVRFKRVAEF